MSKQLFSEPMTDQFEKSWLKLFFNKSAGFGDALETVFDAKLIQDENTLRFETSPENKEKLVYAFKQCLRDSNERGGVYCKERAQDFFERVKKMTKVPELSPKQFP